MWGLFAGLCYSHQLGVVKTECCFTAATLWGLQTSAQTGLIALPLSDRFYPVFLATLTPLPLFPLTVSDTTRLSAHSLILLSNQKHFIWCLDSEPVCHLPSQPACLQTNHVGLDGLLRKRKALSDRLQSPFSCCSKDTKAWTLLKFCRSPHAVLK